MSMLSSPRVDDPMQPLVARWGMARSKDPRGAERVSWRA